MEIKKDEPKITRKRRKSTSDEKLMATAMKKIEAKEEHLETSPNLKFFVSMATDSERLQNR